MARIPIGPGWTSARGLFPAGRRSPPSYNLAGARSWHFLFAWLLVVPGLLYWLWSFRNRHIQRDLAPKREELSPRHIWRDVKNHARLRFPAGAAARDYNILQKASYLAILFFLLPLVVLTGLTMSPGMDSAWPWLLDLFGGRQSARSIHFIAAAADRRVHSRPPGHGDAGGADQRDRLDDHRPLSPAEG